jgi:hypothetical protein
MEPGTSLLRNYEGHRSTVQLNADAKNVFKIISTDKRKIQIFCKIADLGNQLDQANQVHDIKKVDEVCRKLDESQGKLPELTALVGGLRDLDRIPKTLRRLVR